MQNSGSADSFTQQMLNEIERRCKEFQLSSLSIHLNDEFDDKEYETSPDAKHHTTLPLDINNVKDIEFDDGEPILKDPNPDENDTEPIKNVRPETIYANSNVIKQNETYENGTHDTSVPSGRKPALPPKPPNPLRLSLVKPKGYACMAIINKKSPPGKKDPAEMSLKERLALFEKNKGAIVVPKSSLGLSVPAKQTLNITSNGTGHLKASHVETMHTSTLIKTVNQQKPIICDIDIESENDVEPVKFVIEKPAVECELKPNPNPNPNPKQVKEPNEQSKAIDETKLTPKIKSSDVTDSVRRSLSPKPPPPIRKTVEKRKSATETNEPIKIESKVEGEKLIENRRQSRDDVVLRATLIHDIRMGSSYYGDLTPIVTTIAPAKMRPDETIGLNELHENTSNYSLLSDSNQYQAKEEDRWDRFIECLLFFCCVA